MRKITIVLFLLLVQISFSACTPDATRMDDETGDLGQQADAPSPAEVYVKLAVAYMQEGQFNTALQKAKRGLEADPANSRVHNIIALLYERLGKRAKAQGHYEQALRLNSKDPYIRNAYGSFLCAQKSFDEANKHFEAALRNPLYQTPEVALTNAGICAGRSNNKGQAETYFRRALQVNSKFSIALVRMANISYGKGKYLSARGYLQRHLEVAPHTAESLWLGIRIERKLGDLDALASYELLLRAEFPDSEETRLYEESKQ